MEAPVLGKVQEEYRARGVEVIAIDIQPQDDNIETWVKWWRRFTEKDVTWGTDQGFVLGRRYGVLVLGQTAIIDRDGKVVYNGPPLSERPFRQLLDEAS
ncbi:MAG: redoxin family protein [Chloroflexi bacterium]|nr:redoxin family protein [Chloroflexota bacterium]